MRSLLSAALLVLATFAAPISAQIPLSEYADRRARLAQELQDGVLVVRGAEEPVQDYFSFQQNPGFMYLTGFREPGAALLMKKSGSDVQWTLFVLPKDPAQEVWSGRRYGADSAGTATGLPATSSDRFRPMLDSLVRGAPRLYVLADLSEGGDTLNDDDRFVSSIREAYPQLAIEGVNEIVSIMRGTKSMAELEMIRRAAAISMEAHAEAARVLEPGMNEFEIQALIEYTFRRYGGRPGYASIVGSGPNSTVLHYNRDDRFMQPGEVLLIDAAASYGGYTADITRTFPVDGSFTPEQREIYQIVRAAQARAESMAKPGASWQEVGRAARDVIAEGLTRLGLIESPTATYECGRRQCSQVQLYYMHGLGHGIGLEVHDPDQMYDSAIGVGSAFSIEPGIYVRQDLVDIIPDTPGNKAFREKIAPLVRRYANIGVRIEDNYVVTENGLEWITCVPREANEVEALMREPVKGPAARDAERVQWYRGTAADPRDAGGMSVPAPAKCAIPRM